MAPARAMNDVPAHTRPLARSARSARPAASDGPVGVAVIGAGYWGPNLVRNFQSSASFRLHWMCDLDIHRARRALGRYSTVEATDDYARVLADPRVEAVAIATPAGTHRDLAMAALAAGRHVLVEKPLAAGYAAGREVVEEAERCGLTLMCDHTYCYTPAV
ncbi:MAG TPA: Gfo/Idh/MocA family oxidoreductase, partial [Actinospica sp.]|nr:Gfo/Idh/MocA family oxidoreductase [Actinospica sp.]